MKSTHGPPMRFATAWRLTRPPSASSIRAARSLKLHVPATESSHRAPANTTEPIFRGALCSNPVSRARSRTSAPGSPATPSNGKERPCRLQPLASY